MKEEDFGQIENVVVRKFSITNSNGVTLVVHSYGACIQSLYVPEKENFGSDIILGFDSLEGYRGLQARNPYFGCTVGRVANRIKNGVFTLDGVEYELAKNNGGNSLHGGIKGFDKVVWDAQQVDDHSVQFKYVSKDGEEGYPGNLSVKVTYTLTEDNIVRIDYEAVTDAPTPVNLTNHSYFNLAGHEKGASELYEHTTMINAQNYTPVSEQLIPTGEISPVMGTVFDLTKSTLVGDVINKVTGGGFDHNFVIGGEKGSLRLSGSFVHAKSGRKLTVYSTQPGVQFYTGNFIPNDGSLVGKNGTAYGKHGGFCFETQNFPDAVNQENFPNCILRPGEIYKETTEFRLSF